MRTVLLDTNIIIDVLNVREGRLEALGALVDQGVLLACCSINVTEIYMGMRPNEVAKTERFLAGLEYFPITRAIAQLAGEQYNRWRKRGVTLGLPDVTIAAVCLANNLTLMTDNRKDFPMPELPIYELP